MTTPPPSTPDAPTLAEKMPQPFLWLRGLWWARQRSIDLQILWPACKQQAPSIHYARAAFATHAYHEACWIRHYGERGLFRFIDNLT